MDSLTFLDVVAFNQILSERALFHALVHAVQFDILGRERYAELWVRGFLKNRTHFTVPLEVHAFTLTSKFLQSTADSLSVEDHVVRWLVDDRYSSICPTPTQKGKGGLRRRTFSPETYPQVASLLKITGPRRLP